ncbi:MAG: HAD family hydrolase [Bdellovibrionales bacterium]
MQPPPAKHLAVFDFDDTLIEGDSLWPFLVLVSGYPAAIKALMQALFLLALRWLNEKSRPEQPDTRTFIKSHLLKKTLAGRHVDTLAPAIEKLRRWQKWKAPVRAALLDHFARGHQIVIASGGLDIYLPALLQDLPPCALICTRMEIESGIITGVMPSGNCVRRRKAEILANYLEKNGPFSESWGYGNYPHDMLMLELLRHRIFVS